MQAQVQIHSRWSDLGFSPQARIQPAAAFDSWLQLFRCPLADLPSTVTLKQLLTSRNEMPARPRIMTLLAAESQNLLPTVAENLPADCPPSITQAATWDELLTPCPAQDLLKSIATTTARIPCATRLLYTAFRAIIGDLTPAVPGFVIFRRALFVPGQHLLANIRNLGVPLFDQQKPRAALHVEHRMTSMVSNRYAVALVP